VECAAHHGLPSGLREDGMKHWEHKATRLEELEHVGPKGAHIPIDPIPPEGEGWELVAMVTWTSTTGGIFYWKREAQWDE
jgi:hypothetical protein